MEKIERGIVVRQKGEKRHITQSQTSAKGEERAGQNINAKQAGEEIEPVILDKSHTKTIKGKAKKRQILRGKKKRNTYNFS